MSKQINTFNSAFFLQPIDQQYSKKESINTDNMIDLLNISTDSESDDVVHKAILMKYLLKDETLCKFKLSNYLKIESRERLYIHRLKTYKKYSILVSKIHNNNM